MHHRRFMFVPAALLLITAMSSAQTTPEGCLSRLNNQLEELLKKEQPPLYAWHLRSLKSLAQAEYAKLAVNVAQRGHPVAEREKEFVEFTTSISNGFDRGDCSNPDLYLKEGRRGLVLARASDLDGSLQYMMVDLPKDWDPNRAYPLMVGLHGTGPDNPLAYPSYGFGALSPAKPEDPTKPKFESIHLTPWGRGNRGWRGDSERDVFEAINQLKTFAKLDPDRWYITGHSAGGDGSWAIVQHTPDLWAAAGMQSGSMLSGPPDWVLIPNMTYVPFHILIGENDNLPSRIPDSKEAYRILKEAGDETKLVIIPGVGHYPLTDDAVEEQATWMTKFARKRPDHFVFTADQPHQPGVWGVTVPFPRGTRLVREPWPHFEVEIKGQEVRIKTKNLKDLNVDLGPSGLRMTGDVRLLVNGKEFHHGAVPAKPLEVKGL